MRAGRSPARLFRGPLALFGGGALALGNVYVYVYVGTWYDVLPPYFSSFLADAAQAAC